MAPIEKTWFYENRYGITKYNIKDTMSIKISFKTLHEVSKSNVTSSLQEIGATILVKVCETSCSVVSVK